VEVVGAGLTRGRYDVLEVSLLSLSCRSRGRTHTSPSAPHRRFTRNELLCDALEGDDRQMLPSLEVAQVERKPCTAELEARQQGPAKGRRADNPELSSRENAGLRIGNRIMLVSTHGHQWGSA
jgi:hypothetical protein